MNAIDTFRLKIRQALSSTLNEAAWGKPQAMSKVLEELRSVFDTAADPCSGRSITKTLESFRTTRELPTFLDLKYVCLGITQEVGNNRWKLLEDPELFPLLLKRVDSELPGTASLQGQGMESPLPVPARTGGGNMSGRISRRFLKCYQGLLSGYFDYNIYSDSASEIGRENWMSLRTFLHDRLSIAGQVSPLPRWVQVLQGHENLLSDDLYERYGAALAQGNFHDLKSACESLLIPRNSWVWEATVFVRIKAVCAFEDNVFMRHVDQSLAMITQSKGIALSGVMKRQCMAYLLKRYARCASRPVHAGLLDAAMTTIGNPWAGRAAWDASVNDEHCRAMLCAWLRRRLIRDFFRILSEDKAADNKRLRNWLRFEHKIDDMWFALGPHAFNHTGPEFEEFRKLAGDRILQLENGGRPENNALIMRIDDYVFVEFGSSDYSITVFKNSNLPFDLDRKWICIGSKPSGQQMSVTCEQALKQCMIDSRVRQEAPHPARTALTPGLPTSQ
jgi:hypothetical protein